MMWKIFMLTMVELLTMTMTTMIMIMMMIMTNIMIMKALLPTSTDSTPPSTQPLPSRGEESIAHCGVAWYWYWPMIVLALWLLTWYLVLKKLWQKLQSCGNLSAQSDVAVLTPGGAPRVLDLRKVDSEEHVAVLQHFRISSCFEKYWCCCVCVIVIKFWWFKNKIQ